MTVQLVVPNPEPKCPRGDRLQEEPSAKNAQGLFPPEACIFVGNLSTKVPTETLAEDLKSVFTRFGACHVKIKQDKKKGLPGAFIQFERVEDASAALASEESTILHDRILRIERAKGRRTACLGLRSLQPITARDVLGALEGRGSLEVYTIEPQQAGYQTWTDIAKVTFAFVDDCRDAIKYFQKDEKYFLHLLDMDGSPLLQGPVQGPGSRPRPYNGHFSPRGNFQPRNNNRQHRNGNGNYHRNNNRGGFPRVHHSQMNGENMAPRGGYMPTPPNMMNAMPINNDIYPPFFQPPPPFQPHPHGPNGYSLPPPQFIVGPHPVHMGPHQHIDTVGPPPPLPSGGHYMIHGQPIWSSSPPIPPYFPPHMYPQEHGYFGPQPGMNGPPNGYFGPVDNYGPVPVGAAGPMPYVEPWPGHARSSYSPPTVNEKGSNGHFPRNTPAPMQPHNVHASFTPREKVVVDQSSEETVGGCPLNPKTPEKAPRLIRVYHDDDDDDDDDEYPKTGSEKASSINAVVVSVHEITDNDSATEAECRSRSRSRSLSQDQRRTRSQSSDSRSRSRSQSLSGSRSRSVSASGIRQSLSPFSRSPAHSRSSSSDSQKSKKSVRWSENLVMDGSKPPSRSNSTSSTTSSRTCASPTQKPVGTISPTKSAMKSSRTSTSPTQMHVDTVSPTNKTITSSRICTSPTQKPVDTFSPTKKKIEEYVRSEAHGKGLSEVELQEVIESLMEEQAAKAKEQEEQALMAATDEYQPMTGTDPGGSPNGSVAQKKSV